MKTDCAIIDMDGTILSKRSIDVLCDSFDLTSELKKLDLELSGAPRHRVTKKLIELLAGKKKSELACAFDSIPLNDGIDDLVSFLKDGRVVVAVATDSYKFLADRLKDRLNLDLAYGNTLQFDGEILTGKVLTVPGCLKIPWCKEYFVCKLRLLKSLQGALRGRSVAIGDSDSDLCMLEGADISIAYRPKTRRIIQKADISVQDFKEAIEYLQNRL